MVSSRLSNFPESTWPLLNWIHSTVTKIREIFLPVPRHPDTSKEVADKRFWPWNHFLQSYGGQKSKKQGCKNRQILTQNRKSLSYDAILRGLTPHSIIFSPKLMIWGGYVWSSSKKADYVPPYLRVVPLEFKLGWHNRCHEFCSTTSHRFDL